ncbi:MAG: hypothetical protein ACYDBQ_01320 [Thermoplasmatota archaeon]
MVSDRDSLEFVLAHLRSPRFTANPMFGEFTAFADGKVVALVWRCVSRSSSLERGFSRP